MDDFPIGPVLPTADPRDKRLARRLRKRREILFIGFRPFQAIGEGFHAGGSSSGGGVSKAASSALADRNSSIHLAAWSMALSRWAMVLLRSPSKASISPPRAITSAISMLSCLA